VAVGQPLLLLGLLLLQGGHPLGFLKTAENRSVKCDQWSYSSEFTTTTSAKLCAFNTPYYFTE
jgi:hypothetical protein